MKLRIVTKSPLLIGGYSNANPFADLSTARLDSGIPVIPASVVKGAVRVEFERMFAPVCTQGNDSSKCPDTCPACKVFGRVGDYQGLIMFSDAVAVDAESVFSEKDGKNDIPTGDGYTERPGVTINRKLRTSEENKLFLFETTEFFSPKKPLIFETDLKIAPELIEDKNLWNQFKASVDAVFAIGGSKSRGMGMCEFRLMEVEKALESMEEAPDLDSPVIGIKLHVRGNHLTIGAHKPYRHFLETLYFIPGSTFRGAVAKKIIRKNEGNPPEKIHQYLKSMFADSGLIFDDCIRSEGFVSARLLPNSAKSCKICSGFRDDDDNDGEERHGVIDTVIPDLVRQFADLPVAYQPLCHECKGDMTPFSGYYKKDSDFKCKKVNLRKHIVTRSAQNRKLRRSDEGMLFSIESVKKTDSFTFAGTLRNVPERLWPIIKEWHGQVFRIGAKTSGGYGEAVLSLENVAPPEPSDIETRIVSFNERLKEKFRECSERWGPLCKIDDHHTDALWLTIDLLSHAILLDDLGLHAGMLPKTLPQQWTGGVKTERERGYARTELVSGWFAKRSPEGERQIMPKRVQQAISRGSVFVYRIEGITQPSDELLDALCKLEMAGIGERGQEGYGHIKICDEFHYKKEVY